MIDLTGWDESWRKRPIRWRSGDGRGEVSGLLLGFSHYRDQAIIAVPTGKPYPPSEIIWVVPDDVDFEAQDSPPATHPHSEPHPEGKNRRRTRRSA